MESDHIRSAARAIQRADALVIAAGAGIGVDSGLPDFRGNAGFWRAYPPLERLGIEFHQMANPTWFDRDPALAWGFYGHRLHLYRTTEPHGGFQILLRFAQQKPAGAFVFTSNVDGQFQKAGFSEEQIVECHGSIHHLQCRRRTGIWPADNAVIDIDTETLRARSWPVCACCNATARPNILMFGDSHWDASRTDYQMERMEEWLDAIRPETRLAVIEIGAGPHIPTVRRFSEELTRSRAATLIRINPRNADGPASCISLPEGALECLQAIERAM